MKIERSTDELRSILLRKGTLAKKFQNDDDIEPEYALTDESYLSIRTTLGVKSNNYETTNDTTSNSYSLSTSGFVSITTNNLGYAEVIVSPNFLISRDQLTGFKKQANLYVSNIFLANQDNKTIGQFDSVIALKSSNVTSVDFDTYKLQRLEIRVQPRKFVEPSEPTTNDLEVPNDTIKFQMVDGKAINVVSRNNYLFKNRLINELLNKGETVCSSYQFPIDKPAFYCMNAVGIGDVRYNKNGCNTIDEPPLCVMKLESLDQLMSTRLLKYSTYLSGFDTYKFTPKDSKNAQLINYIQTIYAKGENQDGLYNQANQNNDKILRILIHSTPYKKILFQVNGYYTVKIRGDIKLRTVREEIQQFNPKPYMPAAAFEKNYKQVVNTMIVQNPTVDGAFLTRDLNGQLRGIGSFFSGLWNTVKGVATTVVNTTEKVVNKVSSVVETAKAIISPNPDIH